MRHTRGVVVVVVGVFTLLSWLDLIKIELGNFLRHQVWQLNEVGISCWWVILNRCLVHQAFPHLFANTRILCNCQWFNAKRLIIILHQIRLLNPFPAYLTGRASLLYQLRRLRRLNEFIDAFNVVLE